MLVAVLVESWCLLLVILASLGVQSTGRSDLASQRKTENRKKLNKIKRLLSHAEFGSPGGALLASRLGRLSHPNPENLQKLVDLVRQGMLYGAACLDVGARRLRLEEAINSLARFTWLMEKARPAGYIASMGDAQIAAVRPG